MPISGLAGGAGGGELGLMLQLALKILGEGKGGIQQLAQQAGQAGLSPPPIASEPGSALGGLVQPTAVGPPPGPTAAPVGVPGAPGGVSPNLGGQSAAVPKPPIPPEAEQMNKQAALLKALAALRTPEAQQLPPAAPAISPAAGRQVQAPGLEELLAALLGGAGGGQQVGPSLGALIAG